MKRLAILIMFSLLSGCMMPNALQIHSKNSHAKYKKLAHSKMIKHHVSHDVNNDNSTMPQDGVPIVNLMARQGGEHA